MRGLKPLEADMLAHMAGPLAGTRRGLSEEEARALEDLIEYGRAAFVDEGRRAVVTLTGRAALHIHMELRKRGVAI